MGPGTSAGNGQEDLNQTSLLFSVSGLCNCGAMTLLDEIRKLSCSVPVHHPTLFEGSRFL